MDFFDWLAGIFEPLRNLLWPRDQLGGADTFSGRRFKGLTKEARDRMRRKRLIEQGKARHGPGSAPWIGNQRRGRMATGSRHRNHVIPVGARPHTRGVPARGLFPPRPHAPRRGPMRPHWRGR